MLDLFEGPLFETVLGIAVVALAIWFIYKFTASREGFAKEFIDNSNEQKTEKTRASSYRQETNSFKPTLPAPEPIQGIRTPFRVNMYDSYVPA